MFDVNQTWVKIHDAGPIPGLCSANERGRYTVTESFIG